MNITQVFFSILSDKWYIRIDNYTDIEISEMDAKFIVTQYDLEEYNMNRWRKRREE